MKIFVSGISNETNTFSPMLMDIPHFKKNFWFLGKEIEETMTTTKETRGTLEYLHSQNDVEIAYGFVAHGVTAGPVKAEDYHIMRDLIIDTLRASLPVDGVVLNMHGAMQSEDCFDCEGDLFARVRAVVGPDVPITSSFDLHACITPQIMENLDGLAAFRTYPHTDHADTGYRAAKACVELVRAKLHPRKLYLTLPLILAVENCNTADGPIVPILAMTDELLADPDVLSGALNLTQPWLDVPDLGCQISMFVRPGADVDSVRTRMAAILRRLWEDREKFVVEVPGIEEALEISRDYTAPVCVVELGDIVSAGGASDSTVALRAMLKSDRRPACVTIMDAETVAKAVEIGLGNAGDFLIGGKKDAGYNTKVAVHATVEYLSDAHVAPEGDVEKGMLFDFGMRAQLKTDDGLYIIVSEFPNQNHDRAMMTSMKVDPREMNVIIQKTHQMFKEGYRGVMGSFIYSDTEGYTDRNLKRLPFKNVRHPICPVDECELPEELRN